MEPLCVVKRALARAGVKIVLKNENNSMLITAIEPEKMPMLSGGSIIGNHKIEGIGDDFIPELINKNDINEVILIPLII